MSGRPAWSVLTLAATVLVGACSATVVKTDDEADRLAIAALDTEYQVAVGRNDAGTMARIQHENLFLVMSSGAVVTGAQLLQLARDKAVTFEQQAEIDDSRVIRIWGDSAVVTAKLWQKGTRADGTHFDHKLWFSDTWVRTPGGWRYSFGQAGAPLPGKETLKMTNDEDRKAVAALDTEYQAAVERNDAATMARIHDENMILVISSGSVVTGKQLEQAARDKARTYERQVEVDDSQIVRVWGDTAVVTAKLWLKGAKSNGDAFDYKLWFSDTYVRTPTGWRYAFGQAGAPLPK